MKTTILAVALFISSFTFGQVGEVVGEIVGEVKPQLVKDPTNAAKLISIGKTIIKVKENGDKITAALNTIEAIKYYSNITSLISTFEDSYCILQDLDVSIDLDTEGLFTSGCTKKFKYKFNLMKIEKSVKSITLAITSKLMTISEREKTITDAVNNFQKANKELAEMNKELTQKLAEKKEKEQFKKDIKTVYQYLED